MVFLAKSENFGVENFLLKSGHIEEIMAHSSLMWHYHQAHNSLWQITGRHCFQSYNYMLPWRFSYYCYYLCQGGCVFIHVCLFVCLFVELQNKLLDWFLQNSVKSWQTGPGRNH